MRRALRNITTAALGAALLSFFATGAAASPKHSSSGAGDHQSGIEWFTPPFGHDGKMGVAWSIINFVVLLVILEKLLFSKLRARQAQKHDTVKLELERASTAKAEAQQLVTEFKERLTQLDVEISELMEDSKRRAEADRLAIIHAAREEADRIREAARAAAVREAESQRRKIENEIVDRAIDRAQSLIRDRMDPQEHAQRVDAYVTQLTDLKISDSHGQARAEG